MDSFFLYKSICHTAILFLHSVELIYVMIDRIFEMRSVESKVGSFETYHDQQG